MSIPDAELEDKGYYRLNSMYDVHYSSPIFCMIIRSSEISSLYLRGQDPNLSTRAGTDVQMISHVMRSFAVLYQVADAIQERRVRRRFRNWCRPCLTL